LDIQRVHADRTVDVGIAFGQGFYISRILGADADTEEVPDATLTRSVKGRIKGSVVLGKIEAVKMTMGIYEHKRL